MEKQRGWGERQREWVERQRGWRGNGGRGRKTRKSEGDVGCGWGYRDRRVRGEGGTRGRVEKSQDPSTWTTENDVILSQ